MKSEKVPRILLILILLVSLAILSLMVYNWLKPIKDGSIQNHLKDTIVINHVYIPKLPQGSSTYIPDRVIVYQDTNRVRLDSLRIKALKDSFTLVISTLEKELTYSSNFIFNNPESPKLIDLNINRDSLWVTTLPITGYMETKRIDLDLNSYGYYLTGNTFSSYKYPMAKESLNILYCFNGGFDFMSRSPFIGLEGYLGKNNKYPLFMRVNLPVLKLENTSIQLGLRTNFKKWHLQRK